MACWRDVSKRRACSLVAADRKMIRYGRATTARHRALGHRACRSTGACGYHHLSTSCLRDEGDPSGINRIYGCYHEAASRAQARDASRGGRSPHLESLRLGSVRIAPGTPRRGKRARSVPDAADRHRRLRRGKRRARPASYGPEPQCRGLIFPCPEDRRDGQARRQLVE